MSSVTELQRTSSEMISPYSKTHNKTSALDQKVNDIPGSKIPCAALLAPCLENYLKGKVSKAVIADAANHLQDTLIPTDKEHSTIQGKLLNWKGLTDDNFESRNRLHAAIIHCINSKEFKNTPAHQLSVPNHSDK